MESAKRGLPEHLFKYISSITPMINIDLVVYEPKKGIYLSWRDDDLYGPGWHVPGGIIRFKESIIDRINIVAKNELGINKLQAVSLVDINQIVHHERDIRGHFISLLFLSPVTNTSEIKVSREDSSIENGSVALHEVVPRNMIAQHKRYGSILNRIMSGERIDSMQPGNLLN